jgi:xanthine dehydrogenase accessory factor
MRLPTPAEVLLEAARAVESEGRAVLCHVVRTEGSTPGKAGWKLLLHGGGEPFGNLGGGAFEALVKVDAAARLADPSAASEVKRYYFTERAVKGEPTGMVCGGLAEVFLEVMVAQPMLVICGGGPVGQALARAGDLAGFRCLVAEDREEFRDPALFPDGVEVSAVDRDYADDFLAPWARRDLYAAVVTRCWETDVTALASLLRQAPPGLRYLGLMGSRRKVERVRVELEAQGCSLDDVDLRAPIGLPVGGDSPGEIAISVLAEILQVRHGQGGKISPPAQVAGGSGEAPASGATAGEEAIEVIET